MLYIKLFEEYEYDFDPLDELNEELNIKKGLLSNALALWMLFNSIPGDTPRNIGLDYLKKYVLHNDVSQESNIKQARDYVKNKVKRDPRIKNKDEVLSRLDSTLVFYNKGDVLSKAFYKKASTGTSSFATTTGRKHGNIPIIFFDKDADINEMIHEFSHIVDFTIKNNKGIEKMFDFNKSPDSYKNLFKSITNNEREIRWIQNYEFKKKYNSDPKEIYARLNSLKLFLHRYGFLNNPNDDIDKEMAIRVFNGSIYKELDDNGKEEFLNSDFMSVLPFFNMKKWTGDINKYVQGKSREIKKYT